MEHRAKIIVPLYIYPLSDETWWTLYQAYVIPNLLKAGEVANLCLRNSIHSHPSTDFLVVVNPNSGPGGFPLPSHDYIREVSRLNNYKNVTTVGYVLIDYCRRPLSDVVKDIDTYAGWATNQEYLGLGLGGIFLDETPNHFSGQCAEFLATTNQHIKAAAGFSGDKLIIHNPGTPPDPGLADPGPDVIITCEEPYEKYKGHEVQKRLKEYYYGQSRSGYMISGTPREEISSAVRELRHRGAYVFVTDLVDDIYESFGPSWTEFITAMDKPQDSI